MSSATALPSRQPFPRRVRLGERLVSYPLGGKPVTLGTTLLPSSFAVPAPGGVTLVRGGDRYLWDAKTLRSCALPRAGAARRWTPSLAR